MARVRVFSPVTDSPREAVTQALQSWDKLKSEIKVLGKCVGKDIGQKSSRAGESLLSVSGASYYHF